MINGDGWLKYCIWEHSASLRALYERRCLGAEAEMTCAAQAAEALTPLVRAGDSLLDVGCGSGYFYHSLRRRQIPVEYYGIDAAPSLIEIGRRTLPSFGLDPARLSVLRIEDLDARVDHCVCLNVLSNLDNYHRPLERILKAARQSVILRESIREEGEYAYVSDGHLDERVDLKVHVNAYPAAALLEFVESYGFAATMITDRRTGGEPEMVIGHPHYWTMVVARRRQGGA